MDNTKLTIERLNEIHCAIYDGSIDFYALNIEERSLALGIVINACSRNEFKHGHFNAKQFAFLNEARESLFNKNNSLF